MMSFDPHKFSVKKQFGPDTLHIRPATIDDKDLVWNAYKNAPAELYYHVPEVTLEYVERWYPAAGLDPEKSLFFNAMRLEGDDDVEFVANMTVAFQQISRFKHTAIFGIVVLPDYQGRGLGYFLTDLGIRLAKAKLGIIRLELQVCAGNKRARNIYKKLGFEEEGVLRTAWLYPDGKLDDLITMSILFPEKMKNLTH
ncbi:MAG: GNAT family N-acetyltransferase [Candidatus Odinarchaeota archaeon]